MNLNNKTVAIETLGCRLNQADTALMSDRLEKIGLKIVRTDYKNINIFIINSCTVTAMADKKSRQLVKSIKKKHPDVYVVFTGCSVKVENSIIEKDKNIDLIVYDRKNIAKNILSFFNNIISTEISTDNLSDSLIFEEEAISKFHFKTRGLLKIQEGCNNYCSYCIVPYVRGHERSRDWDEIICEFRRFIKLGYKEIVLTGVNINAYDYHSKKLPELLAELAKEKGDFRIRLSSTEPNVVNRKLIDVIAKYPKICNYLHLSLQYGSNNILAKMNRRYTTEEYASFVEYAFQKLENLHLGTDIIVGFPEETEDDFNSMLDFIKKISFANIHIFTYSKREGTPAINFKNQVPANIAKVRYNKLAELANTMKLNYIKQYIGQTLKILTENKDQNNCYSGWSENYLKVKTNYTGGNNRFIDVKINEVKNSTLIGNIL